MITNLNQNLMVSYDEEKKCYAITNINQDITFFIDDIDINIINSGCTFSSKKLRANDYIIAKNYNKDGKDIPLYTIILHNEIEEYFKEFGYTPTIYYVDGNSYNLCRNNLKLVSKRISNIIIKKDHLEDGLGVKETNTGYYKMQIKDSNYNIYTKVYPTKEQAYVVYDCLVDIFYPGDNNIISNYILNKYTLDDFEKYKINNINDLYESSELSSHSTSSSVLGYYDLSEASIGTYVLKLSIPNKKRITIGSVSKTDELGIIKLLAKREAKMCEYENCKANTNMYYPKDQEKAGLKFICGIIQPQKPITEKSLDLSCIIKED